jgi:hypothetical protein
MTPAQAQDEFEQILKEKEQANPVQKQVQTVEANTRETEEKKNDAENAGTSDMTTE